MLRDRWICIVAVGRFLALVFAATALQKPEMICKRLSRAYKAS